MSGPSSFRSARRMPITASHEDAPMTDVVEHAPSTARRVTIAVAVVVGAVALVVRWIGLDLPPLAYSAHRQLTDALMSRGYWQHLGGDLPPGLPAGFEPWVPGPRPPVLQGLGALTYVIVGQRRCGCHGACSPGLGGHWAGGLGPRAPHRRLAGAMVAVGVWLFALRCGLLRSYQPTCRCSAWWWPSSGPRARPGARQRRSWWLAVRWERQRFVKPTAALAVFRRWRRWRGSTWVAGGRLPAVRRHVVAVAVPTVATGSCSVRPASGWPGAGSGRLLSLTDRLLVGWGMAAASCRGPWWWWRSPGC